MADKIILYAHPTSVGPSGGFGPHYRLEDGKLYREYAHPDGKDYDFACCCQSGDYFYQNPDNKYFARKRKSWLDWPGQIFRLSGNILYTGSDHPDGAGKRYYELREKPEDIVRREQKKREEKARQEKEEAERKVIIEATRMTAKQSRAEQQAGSPVTERVIAKPTPAPAPAQPIIREATKKICPSCKVSYIPAEAIFCDYCHSHNVSFSVKPGVRCLNCHSLMPLGSNFCGYCTEPLHVESDQKKAVVIKNDPENYDVVKKSRSKSYKKYNTAAKSQSKDLKRNT